jgi:hypothetical protein
MLCNKNDIMDYFLNYPNMVEVVNKALELVKENFENAKIHVEIQGDEIVLNLKLPTYPQDTMKKIREIRQQYRPLMAENSGWLLLTTDFQPLKQV